MSDFIIQRSLGVKVFGEEQVDYTVNGQTGVSFDMAVSKAALRRATGIERALDAYMLVVQRENTKLQELSEALAIISRVAARFSPKDKTTATQTDDALVTAGNIMRKYGVSTQYLSGNKLVKQNVDLNKTYIQNAIDLENTNVQQNVVVLQNLNNDRDSAFKLAATLQQKAADTMSTGISNIR